MMNRGHVILIEDGYDDASAIPICAALCYVLGTRCKGPDEEVTCKDEIELWRGALTIFQEVTLTVRINCCQCFTPTQAFQIDRTTAPHIDSPRPEPVRKWPLRLCKRG